MGLITQKTHEFGEINVGRAPDTALCAR